MFETIVLCLALLSAGVAIISWILFAAADECALPFDWDDHEEIFKVIAIASSLLVILCLVIAGTSSIIGEYIAQHPVSVG